MPLSPGIPDEIPIPEATGQFMTPNTNTTTRTDFTDFFLRFRHAKEAHPHYIHFFTLSQQLAGLLINHPVMEPNREQTFSTPANSKNKVYFMWDFILRTFQILVAKVEPQDPYHSGEDGAWEDVMSRSAMAGALIRDMTGKLERGNAAVGYSDDEGVDFGDEVKELAGKLVDLPVLCETCDARERKRGGVLLQCAKCKRTRYCSVECQKGDWKRHKKSCGKEPVQQDE